MPRRPRVNHKYATKDHVNYINSNNTGMLSATTVFSHASEPWGGALGATIDLVHPVTNGPDHPDVEEHNATKENPQMELFQHHGPMLDNYQSHTESGHTAPIVLGIAAHLSKKQFGVIPEASTDLSEHSIRVANTLQDAIPNYSELPKQPTNYLAQDHWMNFNTSEHINYLRNSYPTPVSSEDVDKGTEIIKQVVKRRIDKRKQAKAAATAPAPTPTAPTPTHEQLTIPGV